MLAALEPDTLKLFCENAAKFCGRIVDTRNYLTHYTTELKEGAIPTSGLFYANRRMQLLLIIRLVAGG